MAEVQEIKKSRKIGDVFSDYKTNSNIADAVITKMNLIKRMNTLELGMASNEYIEIKEIWYLEKFLRERFQFGQVHMLMTYPQGIYIKRVDDEWENLICYMAHKYPLMKPMLLMKSDVEINDNIINVKMHIRGADFLRAKKTDKELESVIKKLYGKEYKIELEEILEKEAEIQHERKMKEMEEDAIKHTVAYISENSEDEQSNEPEVCEDGQ